MDKKIFWSDKAHIYHHKDGVNFRGGIYFRSFDLNKFMKLVEKEEGEVVVMPLLTRIAIRPYVLHGNTA